MVARGVQSTTSGKVAIFWEVSGKPNSITIWDSLADAKLIHGHGGHTEVIWEDE